jgi:hypothetical protein
MKKGSLPISLYYLIRGLAIAPDKTTKEIIKNNYVRESFVLFLSGAILTFLKSFYYRKENWNFFANENYNKIFTFLSIPQIQWLITYLIYFLFIYLIYLMNKLFNKNARFKPLAISLMSLSGLGCILQILFYILSFIFPKELIHYISYIILIWFFLLSLISIKNSQGIFISRSIACFVAAAVPCIIIAGFPGVFPYLAWFD